MAESADVSEPHRETLIRYINRSALKLAIAHWHKDQFEAAEAEYTGEHFMREQFLDAFGHSDGTLVQLAGAFDAFACAVAHHLQLDRADRASFEHWNRQLADVGGRLGEHIQATATSEGFGDLMRYRHLVAHRTVLSERISLRAHEQTGVDEVSFSIADQLPEGASDEPRTPVRKILARNCAWTRVSLGALHEAAIQEMGLEGDPQLRADLGLR